MGAGGLRVWREGGGFQGSFRVCELYRRSGALFPGSRRRWKRYAHRFHRRFRRGAGNFARFRSAALSPHFFAVRRLLPEFYPQIARFVLTDAENGYTIYL